MIPQPKFEPEKTLSIANLNYQKRERILIRKGKQFHSLKVEDIAIIYFKERFSCILSKSGTEYLTNHSLEQLINVLPQREFFQVNRQVIIGYEEISKIHIWFNSKLKVEMNYNLPFDIIVTRERVEGFKNWLNS